MKDNSIVADIKTRLKDFTEETTLHGVRYLAKSDTTACVRSIWIFIILGMTASYAVIVSNSIQAYLR